ncbi:2-amino-4-hydroxy-6-hydroxymethyldihydropteridine diphosphokinase [Acinetobacter larvae]|uniref:2-amino-4-hydroxy-6-hydroxymethyldihydropteridine diphosphokinase n=1 Tax=Acinetobacter larvae TaxID=1789224 RepID=A0A1B2M0N3_9GAMM|nr:2-amino-4-hydroxy-6-hydroxymethyldihydropteridine diphosphokinase [Acinetobacter larvae]AOA58583.1 2-amino-4-hydroxy-6-hydroxymethyldihydropteridine pyrophosphokinase [Acinetobacter larvae]
MNVTETIFALALASNLHPKQHIQYAIEQLRPHGLMQLSSIYEIPCRDGVGADYYNAAALLSSHQSVAQIQDLFKQLEQSCGRHRPSHDISLDVDLIAWGADLQQMQFNPKKLPLALDVKIPLYEIWQHADLKHIAHHYPQFSLADLGQSSFVAQPA